MSSPSLAQFYHLFVQVNADHVQPVLELITDGLPHNHDSLRTVDSHEDQIWDHTGNVCMSYGLCLSVFCKLDLIATEYFMFIWHPLQCIVCAQPWFHWADVGPFQVTAGAVHHNRHHQMNLEYNPIQTVALKLQDYIIFGSGHHVFKVSGAHNLKGYG